MDNKRQGRGCCEEGKDPAMEKENVMDKNRNMGEVGGKNEGADGGRFGE